MADENFYSTKVAFMLFYIAALILHHETGLLQDIKVFPDLINTQYGDINFKIINELLSIVPEFTFSCMTLMVL